MISVKRTDIRLEADSKRVILRYFNLGREKRIKNVINRVNELNEDQIKCLLEENIKLFSNRHLNFEQTILDNLNTVKKYINNFENLSVERKKLLGCYFTNEYSIESAALFNPSIVCHPDQSNLNEDELRFIISLRATGEGHISSIEFREGIINKKNEILLNDISRYCYSPKLIEDKENSENYTLQFKEGLNLSERVLFPISESECMGMEDVRFVEFNENENITYYGTYTAYDGHKIKSKLIQTNDFITFNVKELKGKAANDKGMALFPQKINGKYMMISRQDGENMYIMSSDDIINWEEAKLLQVPKEPWEFIQLGNCGSPIELEDYWLLIAHAVGPLRRYVINAYLLDKEDPSIVRGRLKEPLIQPLENEREGYVPNVVYSCGQIRKGDQIIVPYAVSDSASSFAVVSIPEIIENMSII